MYGGNYDTFMRTKMELDESQMKQYQWEQDQIAHMKVNTHQAAHTFGLLTLTKRFYLLNNCAYFPWMHFNLQTIINSFSNERLVMPGILVTSETRFTKDFGDLSFVFRLVKYTYPTAYLFFFYNYYILELHRPVRSRQRQAGQAGAVQGEDPRQDGRWRSHHKSKYYYPKNKTTRKSDLMKMYKLGRPSVQFQYDFFALNVLCDLS